MARTIGRPPGGNPHAGEPEKIRDYPKLNISARPATRALLKATSMIEGRSEWLIVEEAVIQYVARMPIEDRKVIEGLAKRVAEQREG